MAKEFKDWDKRFTGTEIHATRKHYLGNATKAHIDACIKWPYETASWRNDFIRECVYMVEDAARWQLFRVSMKGLSTEQKLYMLKQYYRKARHDFMLDDRSQWDIEACRVDNYLGALVRGGQLNKDLEYVR